MAITGKADLDRSAIGGGLPDIDGPVVFSDRDTTYHADTCAPLRAAGDSGSIGLWAYARGSYPGEPIPDDTVPGLRSVGHWEIVGTQDWGLEWHRNEGIEITCVRAGSLPFSCEGSDFDLTPGYITITRPWQLHRVGRPEVGTSTLTWLILDVGVRRPSQEWEWPSWLPIHGGDLRRLTELLSHNEAPVWKANKNMLRAMDSLQRALKKDVSLPMPRIATAIAEVFIELGDMLEQLDPPLDPYLSSTERSVRMFLDRLPESAAEQWTVDAMARECGLGRTRFAHYCREMTALSPLEYLTAVRLDRAEVLLRTTDRRITDIAFECGFQSSQYFATVFRRRRGMQPLEFREGRAAA